MLILFIFNIILGIYNYRTKKAINEMYNSIGFSDLTVEDKKLFTDFYRD